jgi:lysophospholipase L1-like esterase
MRNGLWLSLLLSFALAGQCKVFGQISNAPGSGGQSGGGSGGGGMGMPMPNNPNPLPGVTLPIMPTPFSPPQVVALRANDVVVFGGDSLTYLGGLPGGWIDSFNTQVQSRLPGQNISVIASGVGGNTAAMLDGRLDSTVLNHNPTVVVIFIGINDVRTAALKPDGTRDLSKYVASVQDMINKCKANAGVRSIVLMTPMAIGDLYDGQSTWDSTIDAMEQDLSDLALSNGVGLSDLRRVIIQGEPKFNPQDKPWGIFMDQSLLHPTALGDQILTGTEMMSFGL